MRCEARRIPRGLEYDLFPNFRAVYHGHGATSYQNVDIQNHGSVPVPTHSQHIHVAEHLAHHEHEGTCATTILLTNLHSQKFIHFGFTRFTKMCVIFVDLSKLTFEQYIFIPLCWYFMPQLRVYKYNISSVNSMRLHLCTYVNLADDKLSKVYTLYVVMVNSKFIFKPTIKYNLF